MSCAPPSVACDDRRREEHSPQPLGKAFLTWKAFKNFAVTNPESADALVCTDTSICAAVHIETSFCEALKRNSNLLLRPEGVGGCSPVSSSFLPAPASRSRPGLQLDSGSAPPGSAVSRSRTRCQHRFSQPVAGSRVGVGPGVAYPKSRLFGV
jgi:hypothetical protein